MLRGPVNGAPPHIVDRVNAEIHKALALPAVAEAIKSPGAEPTPMRPAAFGQVIRSHLQRDSVIEQERQIAADCAARH